jgi:hypothetical protein
MTIAADFDSALASLKAQLAELAEKLVALERENKILREENAILKQGRFGRSSERLDPGQLALFAAEPTGQLDRVGLLLRGEGTSLSHRHPEHPRASHAMLGVRFCRGRSSCCGRTRRTWTRSGRCGSPTPRRLGTS